MDFTTLVWIDSAGYHFVDYPTFLSALTTANQGIFGDDAYLEPDSQDGQFLAILAQAMYDAAIVGASIYNSFPPVTAQGVGLSRVVKINGLDRDTPTQSTVDVVLGGTAGTVITNGICIDTLQQQWLLPTTVTIGSGGTVTVTATAQNAGAVQAGANSVTGIFTPTLGWQEVTNPSAAAVGQPVESDATLRQRQAVSTSIPAQTVVQATTGALYAVTGVTKVRGYENVTATTDGNGVPAHSVDFIVVGGDVDTLAQTIQFYKTPGIQTYGSTTVTTTDSRGMPITINFDVASTEEIQVQISLTPGTGWSTDFELQIAEAIAAQINAMPIGAVATNGVLLLNQLYGTAYLPGTPAFGTYTITAIEIGINSGGLGTSNIAIPFNGNPSCNPAVDVTFIT